MRPRLLDLFCGDGGAAMGYMRAGYDVTGIDIERRRHYPGTFCQGDVLDLDPAELATYDAVHASPPCQAYSVTRHTHNVAHPDLVAPTRTLLEAAATLRPGLPWVIENVVGAPLHNPLTLCATAFGLSTHDDADGRPLYLRRHRLFESNRLLLGVPCMCAHARRSGSKVAGCYGGGSQDRVRAETTGHGGYTPNLATQRRLMGIDWMPGSTLVLAIPPAYTEHLGRQILGA